MIVRLMGGLANQMWHYAFGRSVGLARNEEVFFTKSFFKLTEKDGLLRKFCYCLDAWSLPPLKFVERETQPVIDDKVFGQYQPEVYKAPFGSSFIGPWQCEQYISQAVIRNEFVLRNTPSEDTLRMAETILAADKGSMFLHVRRGDYLIGPNPEFHGAPSFNYYATAVESVRSQFDKVKLFIFSDDPDWCAQNISHFVGEAQIDETIVVGHNKPSDGITPGQEHEDMWLMSLCQHGAIANSSFSWWGAWLGDWKQNRMIFAPSRWLGKNNPMEVGKDLIPERWIKLAN